MNRKTGRAAPAREAAFRVLNRVFGSGAWADIVFEREVRGLDPADRALAKNLVYGVLRWWIRLDWIIDAFSTIKTKKQETRVLNSLRLGVFQLAFLSRIPARVAVDESVRLAGRYGRKKADFVNAVLRRAAREIENVEYPSPDQNPALYISICYSHPLWMVRRWIERLGPDETEKLAEANLEVPPVTIRTNTLVTTRDELQEALEKEGFKVEKTACSPEGLVVTGGTLPSFDSRYYIQDEASQIVSHLLRPVPGEDVLDLCAAPGGKTTHLAQIMKNKGRIVAVDKHPGRLGTLRETARRLDVKIVETIEADVERPGFSGPQGERGFDAVLLDAPCSGLGVLRRSPDIKIRRRPEDIKNLAALQKRLILGAARCVREGGRLVYSVCTFEPEETEEVTEWFLARRKDFFSVPAGAVLKGPMKGLASKDGFLRTYPHIHHMDGFFACRLERRQGSQSK